MTWLVERLDRRAEGVAVSDGARALAPMTLPGEVIDGDAVDGRITQPRIVTPSPNRVRAPCPHYRVCGGCALMHADDGFVADWKAGLVQSALARQGVVAEIGGHHTSPPRSRRRAVLSVRRTKKGALAGCHARASDVVVDISECLVVTPAILSSLPALRQMAQFGGSRSGELSVAVTDTGSGLDVAVQGGKPIGAALIGRLAELAGQQDWARVTWGDQSLTLHAPILTIGPASVTPPPGSFLQATQDGERALVQAVTTALDGCDRVADLFAGIGTFALPLSTHSDVHAVEGLSAPLSALDAAWRRTPGLHRVTTETRDLARRPLLPDELSRFDGVVIDPPRAGAESQARALAQSSIGVIAWVSCDPVTFARDAKIMQDGGYQIGAVELIDQFRWSSHVETFTVFRK
ncbi:MAG: class I SAM-dependent RNA methyltransferase [Paracoccus denitrificans]|nr:MAG: class I SAM-dependent RNA methyltransferase [Paracoccus denitrificans]PZO85328.1 MAG: class I SAM-dependent RNA methyltransferase [Paracoccus denitrificans]